MLFYSITPANIPEARVAEAIKSDLDQQQITLKQLLDLRRCAVVNNLHIFARRSEIMAQAA